MSKLLYYNFILRVITFISRFFFYFLRSFRNNLKILKNNNFNNFYLPNLSINNIIIIDPAKIKYRNSIPMKYKKKSNPFILNFDWDQKNEYLTEFEKKDHTYITCRELFIEGLEIKKCKEFFFFKEQIIKFGKIKNCKNDDEIILYFKKLIKVFENIKKKGVKTNIENNIEFMIDRNCNLVKINGGNHRFFIARILNLKSVPIEIKLIHSNCLSKNQNNKINKQDLNNFIKKIEFNYK